MIPAGIGVQLFISRVINDRGEIGAGERFRMATIMVFCPDADVKIEQKETGLKLNVTTTGAGVFGMWLVRSTDTKTSGSENQSALPRLSLSA